MCQDAPSAASISTHEYVWTIKQRLLLHCSLLLKMSFSAAESLAECYQQQFPDSVAAKRVAIGPNKMSYVVAYGLIPYITDMTTRELIKGQSYFTLHFIETMNAQFKKQMDVCSLLVRDAK